MLEFHSASCCITVVLCGCVPIDIVVVAFVVVFVVKSIVCAVVFVIVVCVHLV